jgi:hypothetical protein
MHRTRSPLALGWEAARANALPALIIQALMLMLLLSFYTSHTAFALLSQLAELKRTGGTLFVIVASVTAGALIPELFLILFFQRGRPSRRNLRNLFFTVPVWGLDGTLVDLLYRNEAAWLGDVATLPVVAAKICVDQFGYNPLFAAPFSADLRMEEPRHLAAAFSRPFHMETLPRQNHSDVARYMGSLDSADGNYLFPAACSPISTFRAGAYFLGAASELHDESVCGAD